MKLSEEEVARIIHEQNSAYQYVLKDTNPSQPWDSEEPWVRDGLIRAVKLIREYLPFRDLGEMTAAARFIHGEWVKWRKDMGWEWGEEKNYESDPPTHPCLRDWDDLPEDQCRKDMATVCLVMVYS